MKNKHTILTGIAILALLFVTLSFTGCGGGGDSPSSVVRKFFTAIEKDDAKAMEQLATPQVAQMMAMFGEKAKGTVAASGKIKSTTEKIDGEKAVVTVTFESGETEDISLIKDDGKWKVTIDK